MNQPGNPDLLADLARRLAARLTEDPTSFAWIFARYQAGERLDDQALANQLGVAPELLARIALCGRPRPDHFREDVSAVAERFGADRDRLAGIVRQVEALDALYRAPADGVTFLAAARDRVAEEPADYEAARPDSGDATAAGESPEDDEGEPR